MWGKLCGGKKNVVSIRYLSCIHSVLKSSPGRWTGNKPIFKGGLKSVILRSSQVFI